MLVQRSRSHTHRVLLQADVDGEQEDVRQDQLKLLRSHLSVELCVQLHQVLSSLGKHREVG